MLGRLDNWLWKGTMDPPLEKVAVDVEAFEGRKGTGDLVTRLSEEIASFDHLVEQLRDAGKQRREGAGESGGTGEMEFVRSMLPTLDALDRILECVEGVQEKDEALENFCTSVRALQRRLEKTMEEMGLRPIASVGTEVDFDVHDVVGVVSASEEYPPNTVVKEQQKGYYYRGKLLRDAKVFVSQ